MSNFPQPLGNLPSGGKRRVFNPSHIKRTDELSLEEQYNRATTEEQKKAIYHKAVEMSERERMRDRMSIG